jgi:hypothetical protein
MKKMQLGLGFLFCAMVQKIQFDIACSHSFVDPRLKIMMMRMIIIIGHECEEGSKEEEGKGKDIKGQKEDQNRLPVCVQRQHNDTTKNYIKEGKEAGMDI